MRSSRYTYLPFAVLCTFILTLMLFLSSVATLHAASSVPQILVFNSYNMGYDWSENEMKGIRSGLAKAFPRVDLFIEHLDTKKFTAKRHFPALADLLEAKYSTRKLDVIIAMDNAALEFATKYRQRISPGTPLVFCGINDYAPEMIAGQTLITGVAEYHDFVGTLKLAMQLHPKSRDVVVIHDFTDTGLAIRKEVIKAATQFPFLKLHFMEEMPLEETVKGLKLIHPDHFVLMLSYTVEKGGRTFSHSEAARLVSGASPVPVYSVYSEQLGNGVVGGRMMEGETQGENAALLAAKIIGGESPEKIPVVTGDLSHPSFDYKVMDKFDIRPASLPDDTLLINKPPSTFAINKHIAWGVSLFILSSAIGIAVLVFNIRRRQRSEEMLYAEINRYQESQEELMATEEMLRAQVEEYLQSQDELQATEEMLRQQIEEYEKTHDQLLATEEMLRVQLEVAEESSQKFKAVFEHSPITVALTGLPDGTFTEVNQAFTDMFGYNREESIGKTTVELEVWLHDSERFAYLNLLRSQGYVQNFEATMRRKGGEEFTVLFSGVRLEIAGKPCVLSAVMEITEQKRLQNQLYQSQKMDVVGQLAGGIAHDFNNMLSGILSAAEILKMRLSSDERTDKMVDTIIEAATRSADLTRELLTFSRKGTVVSKPVYINDTLAAVKGLLERTIDKRILLNVKLDADNPVVLGDQTQLQNALLNLGINARDAMPDGGELTYSTSIKTLDSTSSILAGISLPPGNYLEISVSDSGVGMTKAIMEHIFEPFYTTKHVGKGTGLGLATVYGTVRSHKGEVSVKSQLGVGSVFRIYLPLAEQKSDSPVVVVEATTGSGGILLVDDEEILRDVGRDLLEDLGYTVYLAENGLHALEIFAAHKGDISLVLLDIMMPVMGGKEAFLQLRQQEPNLKVLFCSGFHREGTEAELREIGAFGFINKPYNRIELSQAVAEAMGQS